MTDETNKNFLYLIAKDDENGKRQFMQTTQYTQGVHGTDVPTAKPLSFTEHTNTARVYGDSNMDEHLEYILKYMNEDYSKDGTEFYAVRFEPVEIRCYEPVEKE